MEHHRIYIIVKALSNVEEQKDNVSNQIVEVNEQKVKKI